MGYRIYVMHRCMNMLNRITETGMPHCAYPSWFAIYVILLIIEIIVLFYVDSRGEL